MQHGGFGPCWSFSVACHFLSLFSLLYVPASFQMFWFLTSYMCSGKVLAGLRFPTNMLACLSNPQRWHEILWIPCFSFNVNHLHVSTFMWCADVAIFRRCSIFFKPQPKQPNWSLDAVINSCYGCQFWLKMFGKFRAPTLPGTPRTFSIFSLSLAVWKMASRFDPN